MRTIDLTNCILEGSIAGSPVNGNRWLLNVTFQVNETIIWKRGLSNKLKRIWFNDVNDNCLCIILIAARRMQ